jgi:predicted nucleotide-binding protein (sugar kinase/HSP70/actin superfamily)
MSIAVMQQSGHVWKHLSIQYADRMKVTFPHMGNYSPVFARGLKDLGYDVVPPRRSSRLTLERGAALSPEDLCLPFKLNMGNFLSAIREGAEAIVTFDTRGYCRFRYYNVLQQMLLWETGHTIPFITFTPWHGITELWRPSIMSCFKRIRTWRLLYRMVRLIEKVEDNAWFARPRERCRGRTTECMNTCLSAIAAIRDLEDTPDCELFIDRQFNTIDLDAAASPPRVGIVGEIYVVSEAAINMDLDCMLGDLGIHVFHGIRLGRFISHCWPGARRRRANIARPFLSTRVGGHGLTTVADSVEFARDGFDGIVHVAPFGCMPETTVRPIIARIGRETGIPVLSLSYDEQHARSSYETRLEAFADIISSRESPLQKGVI